MSFRHFDLCILCVLDRGGELRHRLDGGAIFTEQVSNRAEVRFARELPYGRFVLQNRPLLPGARPGDDAAQRLHSAVRIARMMVRTSSLRPIS